MKRFVQVILIVAMLCALSAPGMAAVPSLDPAIKKVLDDTNTAMTALITGYAGGVKTGKIPASEVVFKQLLSTLQGKRNVAAADSKITLVAAQAFANDVAAAKVVLDKILTAAPAAPVAALTTALRDAPITFAADGKCLQGGQPSIVDGSFDWARCEDACKKLPPQGGYGPEATTVTLSGRSYAVCKFTKKLDAKLEAARLAEEARWAITFAADGTCMKGGRELGMKIGAPGEDEMLCRTACAGLPQQGYYGHAAWIEIRYGRGYSVCRLAALPVTKQAGDACQAACKTMGGVQQGGAWVSGTTPACQYTPKTAAKSGATLPQGLYCMPDGTLKPTALNAPSPRQ